MKNNIITASKKVFPQSIFTNEGIKYTPQMENYIPYNFKSQHVFIQIELLKMGIKP